MLVRSNPMGCRDEVGLTSDWVPMTLVAACAVALGLATTACGSTHDGSPARDAGSKSEASQAARDSGAAPLVVTVAGGTLQGIVDGASVSFRGIPYAAPPVGALRWARPGPAPTWTGVRDASLVASYCLQYDSDGAPVGDEDCLFLNVWTPGEHSSSSLPVIFFIHGGDWTTGTGSYVGYDGSLLAAAGPAVVVTINYRLGPLGFLPLPALAAEDPNGSTGNYGLLDQLAALQWVKQNIAAFGGNPKRVTLWGQSAGAWSTLMHLASPLGRGLFARAVSESGGVGLRDLATTESLVGEPYAAELGCAGDGGVAVDGGAALLACLRKVPESRVLEPAPADDSWGPVIDGYFLTEPLMTTFNAGTQAHVPLMLGTTSLEYGSAGLPVIPPGPPVASVTTLAEYENAVTLLFGESNAASILATYPASSYASPQAAYIAMLDDWGMFCPMRRVARAFVASQSESVWRYLFSHVDSNGVQASIGPVHASDLPFWFGTFAAFDFTPDSAEVELSSAMQGYVTRFAAAGDPNGDGATIWPTYAKSTDPFIDFTNTPTVDAGLDTSACDFWDNLP
jgi:para-nitrobenzyl esterase